MTCMKKVKFKTVAALIALTTWSIGSFAQVKTMYVMKNDKVVFQSHVSDVDNVTFDGITSVDTLIVHKNDGSPADKFQLNNIQQLSFGDENLSIETLNNSEMYAIDDIAKLLFSNNSTTGINNSLKRKNFDVFVFVTPAGDVIVESSVTIKSLVLLSIDGKMISIQQCNSLETQCITFLQDNAVGVYLLYVKTDQGAIVKKVVKSLNK